MEAKIRTGCPITRGGIHVIGKPVWDDRVRASVVTCTSCNEQWLVPAPEVSR